MNVAFHVWRHPSGAIQLSIDDWTGEDAGSGFRLAGPKFDTTGEMLLEAVVDERAASEIRRYLDRADGGYPELSQREELLAMKRDLEAERTSITPMSDGEIPRRADWPLPAGFQNPGDE